MAPNGIVFKHLLEANYIKVISQTGKSSEFSELIVLKQKIVLMIKIACLTNQKLHCLMRLCNSCYWFSREVLYSELQFREAAEGKRCLYSPMSHLRAECQCDWCLVARLCQLGIHCMQHIRFNKHDIFHGTFIYIDSCVVLMSRNLFLLYREDFKRHRSTITRPAGCNKSLINFLTDQMMTP